MINSNRQFQNFSEYRFCSSQNILFAHLNLTLGNFTKSLIQRQSPNFYLSLQSRVNPNFHSQLPKLDAIKEPEMAEVVANLGKGALPPADNSFKVLPLTLQSEIKQHQIISLIKGNC